ncbi:MAG TPA: hypothetical protein VMW16_08700 [Sedimentisphaerales bacterium]|nr:hypothetical protein [Sedimentisphaerales bacterium]
MSGIHRDTRKRLGEWQSKNAATAYLAESDGQVHASVADDGGTLAVLEGCTDGSNPPTTMRIVSVLGPAGMPSITFEVRKGDYWQVNKLYTSYVATVWWIPDEVISV